jgi:hypothetical protein
VFLGNHELVTKTRKKPPPRPAKKRRAPQSGPDVVTVKSESDRQGLEREDKREAAKKRRRRDRMPKLPPITAPVVRGPQLSMLERLAADERGDDAPRPSTRSKQPTLASLDGWIVETREVPEGMHYRPWGDRWTMQLEWIDCGRCPKAHGPYWYAYKRAARTYRDRYGDAGKLHKVYVGKRYDLKKARAKLVEVGACSDHSGRR